MDNLSTVAFLVLIIWAVVNLLIRESRISQFGLKSHFLYITYRTARLNSLIKEVADRNRFLFRIIGNLGLAFGVGLATFTVYFLTTNLIRFYNRPAIAVPVAPVLPGVNVSFRHVPYLFLAIVITLTLHEVAHGITAWSEGIPIKNIGLFLAIIIPGAFVEPDEEKFNDADDIAKLRVLASGSLANLATAIICMIVLSNFLLFLSPLYETVPSGALIIELLEGGPAEKVGLNVGDIVYEVNGERTRTLNQFSTIMSRLSPGDTVEMITSIGRVAVKTVEREERAIIGVILSNYYCPKVEFLNNQLGRQIPYHSLVFIFWIYTVGLSTAMFNMLPVFPFDGDRFLEVIVERALGNNAMQIRILYNVIFFGLIIANIVFSFSRFGFATI
ncbi:MAG: site-2 protease family protein [Candidatus Bathyarchaeota archaeon]|nr:MAG: site-2 protease family protein [Candidatus Bathyarchaeota archaeon]